MALGLWLIHDSAIAEANLSVEATAGYTDNLLRRAEGRAEVPVALGLVGTWTETTRHLSADVEGRVDGVTYLKDTYDDELLGQFDGAVTWWAVPERFALVLVNVYGQVSTDPFSPIAPENRQNTNYLSTGPDWFIPLGARTRAYLGGRYGSVRYEETTDSDSERLLGIVGVDRAVSPSSRFGVQASTEAVDYNSSLQSDFDRNEAYVNYEFTRGPQPELTVNAGYTWLSSDTDDRSAPLLEIYLARQVSSGVNLQLELASRFSDAGVDFAAGGFGAGTDPGVIPQGGVFEERSGRGNVDFQRSRTMFSFAVGISDELYETSTLDRRRYEVEVRAERRMTQRMTGLASALWTRSDYQSEGLDREDTDTEYRLEIRRELGPRTSLTIVGLYASRSSDLPTNEYNETRGYLAFAYSLR
jgi:hypothetical protein